MRSVKIMGIVGVVAATLVAGIGAAQVAIDPAIKARQAAMQLYAYNLGQLGAMAKGTVEYDAAAASRAADNLVVMLQLDQSAMWPPGTDSDNVFETAAKPEIWANFPDVSGKMKALNEAALVMQGAAGTDLAALQAAMGGVGGACGACHKAYRVPAD